MWDNGREGRGWKGGYPYHYDKEREEYGDMEIDEAMKTTFSSNPNNNF